MITRFSTLYVGHIELERCGLDGVPADDRRYPNARLIESFESAAAVAQAADRLGYETFWMAEHHFQHEGWECIPNIPMLAVDLAHRTKRIKFGCAFNVVPTWHPLRLAEDHNLSAELFATRNESETRIAPVPYGTLWVNKTRPDGSLNPYYPGNTASSIQPGFTLDPNFTQTNMTPRPGVVLKPGFIVVKWRALDGGQRTNTSINDQHRALRPFHESGAGEAADAAQEQQREEPHGEGVDGVAEQQNQALHHGDLDHHEAVAQAHEVEQRGHDQAGALLDELSKRTITDALSAEASVAVAEAKILTTEIALEASEKLFDLAGSSATRAKHNLDRHWRNARVHTLHDPVRWKYHAVGNFYLNDKLPPRHGAL